jgi:hypothetical protein
LLKFKDVEENDGIAAMPVPVSPMLNGELVASLVTVSAPEAAAVVVGANWTCMLALCPAVTETVPLPLNIVKTPPVTAAPEILTVPVPLFVTLTFCVAVLPSATLPKLSDVEDGLSVPVLVPPVPAPPVLAGAAVV